MPKKTHHVVPSADGGWNVRKGGAERASKHFDNQSKAIDWARSASKEARGELFIHRRDGTIRDRDSHGKDTLPARDKR
jgi:Uncharacterized protein conserved in bacteria (DUF2188)